MSVYAHISPSARQKLLAKGEEKTKMKFVNLTPHSITVRPDGGTETIIPASSNVARCQVTSEKVTELDGIPVVRQVFGTPQGIPEPDPHGNVRYVTSTSNSL